MAPAIDFLKETVQGYSNFEDLQRYHEQKPSPTEAEQALMQKMEARPELQPFLH